MVGHTLTPSPTEQQKGSKGQITIIVVFCASLNNNKVESRRSDVPPLEQWLALTQKKVDSYKQCYRYLTIHFTCGQFGHVIF